MRICLYVGSQGERGPCGVCVTCVENERDSLRSSLSAAEKELADLRLAFGTMLTDHANMADAKRRAEDETNLLRAEVATLKAPADRFDPTTICDPISGVHSGKALPGECICDELRTAYQRGAQDQGAEIERLRSDYERQLADMTTTLEQANALYDERAAEIERLRGALRGVLACRESGQPPGIIVPSSLANRLTSLLSPAPTPSPVDSLTGEAQPVCSCEGDALCPTHFAEVVAMVNEPPRPIPALVEALKRLREKKQPVEAEQPKRPRGDLEGMCPHDCYDSEPCDVCDVKAPPLDEQANVHGEQPKPAADRCVIEGCARTEPHGHGVLHQRHRSSAAEWISVSVPDHAVFNATNPQVPVLVLDLPGTPPKGPT